MSHEQIPQEPTALDYANQLAADKNDQQMKVDQWLAEPGDMPSQQAAQDMVGYLQYRPDKHVAERDSSGRFASHEDAMYDSTLDSHKTDDDKSLNELLTDWAEADDRSDKTRSNDVQTSILSRLEGKGLSDDHTLALIDRLHARKEALRNGGQETGRSRHDDEGYPVLAPLDRLDDDSANLDGSAESDIDREIVEGALIPGMEPEPEEGHRRPGRFTRIRGAMSRAYLRVGTMLAQDRANVSEYFADPVEGERRRRTAIALGVIAAAATTYLSWKGLHTGGSGGSSAAHGAAANSGNAVPTPTPGGSGHNTGGTIHEHLGHGGHKGNHHEHAGKMFELSAPQDGHHDSIWGHMSTLTDMDSNSPKFHDLVGKTLKFNHVTWHEASNLPIGFKFRIPEEVLDELTKPKKPVR